MSLQLRPTFSESWYRVQNLKPKLRTVAQISRQYYRGERWYVVRDPAGNQYHRLSDAAYAFIGLLDGTRSVGEAWELVGGQLADDAPTQPEVIQILSQLYSANLIETNISPDATVLLRRHKRQVSQKTKGRLMNVLFPRIPLWDLDWFLKLWMPVMRLALSPIGGILWLALVIAAIVRVAGPYWGDLWKQGGDLTNFSQNPMNAIWLAITFWGLKMIHELGHGFMCRRFGGEVHELGVMFLVLFPAPYVDASSAWSFPNKWHRVLVGAGGMIFELACASIAAFVWLATKDSAAAHDINIMAYNVMLISSFSTVMFNGNPLLRYDGYYILSDLLEIPNLQYRSREYGLYLIKRYLFRVKWSQPVPHGFRNKFWLLVYYCTSGPWRIVVSVGIMIFVLFKIPGELRLLGMILFLGSVASFALVPAFKTVKYLLLEPELHRHRILAWCWTLGFVAVMFVLLGVVGLRLPFFDVRGEAVMLASNRVNVMPPGAGGLVTEVDVKDGQFVKKGQRLMQLENQELQSQYEQTMARADEIKARIRTAEADGTGEDQGLKDQLKGQLEQARLLNEQIQSLTITAPCDGQVVGPSLVSLRGRWITTQGEQGKPYAEIIDNHQLVAYTLINNHDYQLVTEATVKEPDGTVKQKFTPQLRLASNPNDNVDQKRIEKMELSDGATMALHDAVQGQAAGGSFPVDPSDPQGKKLMTPQFEVRLTVNNQDGKYLPGQRAYIRVRFDEERSIAWHMWRMLQQVMQTTKNT